MEDVELIPRIGRFGMPPPEVAVQLSHVSKSYGQRGEVEVFTDASLRVRRGEFVALTGPVGCGKTTLIRIIAGLERPDSGSVSVLGLELSRANERDLASLRSSRIGFVPQTQCLVDGFTVAQNVELPLFLSGAGREERSRAAEKVLESLGIAPEAGRQVGGLSVGERQLVSVARAIVADPELILMDEPTESLDPLVAELILGLMRGDSILRGKTVIMATHDRKVTELAGRTVRVGKKFQS